MVSKTTSIKRGSFRRTAGFLLAETMVAVGITSLVVLVICAFSIFSGRSFAALFNYVDLDDANRVAIDQLTRDVRQANKVTSCTTNSLVLQDADGLDITYTYDSAAKTLTRAKNGAARVMLQGCDRLGFVIGQRNTVGGSYDVYPAATPATAKVVNVSWSCSRGIFRAQENTEAVQTARIVIRKQGT
jgi:type II secretory pathway component PulJ